MLSVVSGFFSSALLSAVTVPFNDAYTKGDTTMSDGAHVRCLDRAKDMVSALGLTRHRSRRATSSSTSDVYFDATRTLVLKKYRHHLVHTPRERETCVLQKLQQFPWAPRLFCTGTDYMLTSYNGQTACQERLPRDYMAQVATILSDVQSVGVRHNRLWLQKGAVADFLIDERTGRLSLVDYGWASLNGSLAMSCTAHGGRVVSARGTRPHNPVIDLGFKRPETPSSVRMPRCVGESGREVVGHTYRDKTRKVGSQAEGPLLTLKPHGAVNVRGYQRYNISTGGEITFEGTKRHKFLAIKTVLARLRTENGLDSLIDVGCNSGLVSLIAQQAGYRDVLGLDHDPQYVDVFNRVANARHATGLRASVFSFGSPMPTTADVVFCGAILHWVYCLTANFVKEGFGGILKYLLQYTSEFLLVEWIDPSDRDVRGFQHIRKCGVKGLEHQYTRANFERAISQHATLESKQDLDMSTGHKRVLYVMRPLAPPRPRETHGRRVAWLGLALASRARIPARGASPVSRVS